MYFKAKAYTDGIILNWFPLNPELWEEMNEWGYEIQRDEINNGIVVPGTNRVLEPRLVPQDTTWFKEHKDELKYHNRKLLAHYYMIQYLQIQAAILKTPIKFNTIFYCPKQKSIHK